MFSIALRAMSVARKWRIENIALKSEFLTSLRMAFPSFVRTIPPIGSRSIFSIDLGPRVVRTMSETALAALMLAA